MNKLVSIDAEKLANGIKGILLELKAKGLPAEWPVGKLEREIMVMKSLSKKDAEKVSEAVISTGILGWDIIGDSLVLLDS